ncbi:hypothetical protein TNCV_4244381 [Trichonephila clavipes]|nr:hypothetical protein TNCV_4244381 [Trichonephila clavipes]
MRRRKLREMDEKVCGCKHFQPILREMYGRRKVREDFYDSVFEKSDISEEEVEFDNGLGKDVWDIIQEMEVIRGSICHFTLLLSMRRIRDREE